jgi:hypothetical protein
MPLLPLSDDEFARAALGARALAYMHEQKMKKAITPKCTPSKPADSAHWQSDSTARATPARRRE